MRFDAFCKSYRANKVHVLRVSCRGALCTDSGSVLQVQVEVPPTAAKGAKQVKTYRSSVGLL